MRFLRKPLYRPLPSIVLMVDVMVIGRRCEIIHEFRTGRLALDGDHDTECRGDDWNT